MLVPAKEAINGIGGNLQELTLNESLIRNTTVKIHVLIEDGISLSETLIGTLPTKYHMKIADREDQEHSETAVWLSPFSLIEKCSGSASLVTGSEWKAKLRNIWTYAETEICKNRWYTYESFIDLLWHHDISCQEHSRYSLKHIRGF